MVEAYRNQDGMGGKKVGIEQVDQLVVIYKLTDQRMPI
jgi:hypothetical protein